MTGWIQIRGREGWIWSLRFLSGRVIAEQGYSARSRWLRQLSYHCPEIKPEDFDHCWKNQKRFEQKTLNHFLQQKNVGIDHLFPFMKACLVEVVFDILQYEEQNPVSYEFILEKDLNLLDLTLIPVTFSSILELVIQLWQEWQEAGLSLYSPNGVLAIQDPVGLQATASPSAYRNLIHLIDGKRTLRDLAKYVGRDPAVIGRSLLPYLKAGLIDLTEVPELEPDSNLATVVPPQDKPQKVLQPLVSYVEDSVLDSQTMYRVLTQLNFRPLVIQDPMQALPILIEQKPVLIFLDLVMPIINGYELCSQLRRIAAFKETPIIIVTSSDGIVDRLRAKVVGASGFVSKPITSEEVRSVLEKNGVLGEIANVS